MADLLKQPAGRSPLRFRDFRWLISGSATTMLGNAITPVALAFAVLDLGGSATDLGMVVAAFALVEVVTVLFGGVLGDRLPRQLMMLGGAMASSASQAFLAVLLITDSASIWSLGVVGAITGCFGALAGPSSRSLTRFTVPSEALESAVATRRLTETTAHALGFAVGGVLVASLGSGWAVAVDAGTFLISAFCYSRLRVPPMEPGSSDSRSNMLSELGTGFREVLRHTWLWLLIVQALLYHLFYGGAQGVVGPIVIEGEFGRTSWGLALGVLMMGFIVGGLVCLRWRPRRGLRLGVALLSLTAAFPLAMALSDQLWVILLGAFLHGFGLEIFSVNWDLSIQQNIPADRLARVYSLDMVGSFVFRPVGLAMTGPIAEAVGFRPWLLVVAGVMACSSFVALMSRDVRRLARVASVRREVLT
jgi:MFS family permease